MGGAWVEVGADLSGLRAGLSQAQQLTQQFAKKGITLAINADSTPFFTELTRLTRRAQLRSVQLQVNANTAAAQAQISALMQMASKQLTLNLSGNAGQQIGANIGNQAVHTMLNSAAQIGQNIAAAFNASVNIPTPGSGGGGSRGGRGGNGGGRSSRMYNMLGYRGIEHLVGNATLGFAMLEGLRIGTQFEEAADTEAHPERILRKYDQPGSGLDVYNNPLMQFYGQQLARQQAAHTRLSAIASFPVAGQIAQAVTPGKIPQVQDNEEVLNRRIEGFRFTLSESSRLFTEELSRKSGPLAALGFVGGEKYAALAGEARAARGTPYEAQAAQNAQRQLDLNKQQYNDLKSILGLTASAASNSGLSYLAGTAYGNYNVVQETKLRQAAERDELRAKLISEGKLTPETQAPALGELANKQTAELQKVHDELIKQANAAKDVVVAAGYLAQNQMFAAHIAGSYGQSAFDRIGRMDPTVRSAEAQSLRAQLRADVAQDRRELRIQSTSLLGRQVVAQDVLDQNYLSANVQASINRLDAEVENGDPRQRALRARTAQLELKAEQDRLLGYHSGGFAVETGIYDMPDQIANNPHLARDRQIAAGRLAEEQNKLSKIKDSDDTDLQNEANKQLKDINDKLQQLIDKYSGVATAG